MAIPAEVAQRLAYYKAQEGVGVLAPKGWRCIETYGSNGATLYVSPDAINAADLFSASWKGFSGPVIQISSVDGDTSGLFEVAKTIARVFPAHRAFVEGVIAEGIEPASSFPYGPYPADTLRYRRENIVEFRTPARDGRAWHRLPPTEERQSHLWSSDSVRRGAEAPSAIGTASFGNQRPCPIDS